MAVGWIASPLGVAAQWRSVILFAVVAATIGQTIHRLVRGRVELMERISALAHRDPLTGLANRRTWDERLPIEVELAARRGHPLAVALLDLDHFKAFNDEFGHQRGDVLLEEAAAAWTRCLRTGDLLARWGGEEFALLLPDTTADEAAVILDRLQGVMPEGQTFSAGYIVEHVRPGHDVDPAGLLQAADRAMYVAKATGRARAAIASDRPQWLDQLASIAPDEFVVTP